MNRLVTTAVLTFACGSLFGQVRVSDSIHQPEKPINAPHWIWCQDERQPDAVGFFRKEFSVEKNVVSATLRAVGESASLVIYLNGKRIAEIEPYDPLLQLDVTERMGREKQLLAIQSVSVPGPAAIFLRLDVKFDDGSQLAIVTDTTWNTSLKTEVHWNESNIESSDWQSAISFGLAEEQLSIPPERQIGIRAVDNYEQWKQAIGAEEGVDPASFLIATGFQIQLIRSAQQDEDSWVSMAFDPRGRLVVAKEKKGLLRMTLSDDGNAVNKVESINESLEECRGLLFAFGDLYANANNSKALFRLHDGNQDGQFEEVTEIYASSGGVGHGRNDLVLGPDQGIYSIQGDSVDLPKDCLDLTSPYRAARKGQSTKEGHVLRIDPDSKQVRLVAAGLRNPFGIDFNPDGEMFTYDADAEFDMGSPWYRPTRVNHLVPGGDYGWRGVTGGWPPYFPDHPDNALPNFDVGKGSPTAVKFGTKSNFPARYRDALFILDWTYGRIICVNTLPRGASYLCTAETFLKGRPLNVTDLDFAPDGSLYIVTGGRATQSALYRIRYAGEKKLGKESVTVQHASRTAFTEKSRKLRRQLESRLAEDEPILIKDIWLSLGDADPWIRHAARNLLERQPIKTWRERALLEPSLDAALTSLLALARSQDTESFVQILQRLNRLVREDMTRSQTLTAIYSYALCLGEPSQFDADLLEETKQSLNSLYPHHEYLVNQRLSELLVKIGSDGVVSKTMTLLNAATSQSEQMYYLFVLRNVREGWTPDFRRDYFYALSQTKNYLAGEGMSGFLKKIREEAVASLTDAERESLGSLLEDSDPSQVESVTIVRPLVQKWTVEAVLSAADEIVRKPDLAKGEALFAEAACIRCHRLGGRGTFIGPDLTSVSSRFNRHDLLESIIVPSKIIPEKHQSMQIETIGGKSYVGRVVPSGDFRSANLRLATDPQQPFLITEIAKSEIESQQPSLVSWMPTGLLDTFTAEQILDLIAYIESGGQQASP